MKENEKAFEALEEKTEREKGCDYCKLGKSINGERDVCIIKVNKKTLLLKYSDDFYSTDVEINYCPMCGRKLEVRK